MQGWGWWLPVLTGPLLSANQWILRPSAGVRLRGTKCFQSSNSWQQPEIRTNLGEPLSLWDKVKPLHTTNLSKREERAAQWQGAHCKMYHPPFLSLSILPPLSHPSPTTAVPNAVVVSSPGGELALRLHFEAEHSNVLVVTAELLNGCLSTCEVLAMKMELLQDMYPQFPVSHIHTLLTSRDKKSSVFYDLVPGDEESNVFCFAGSVQ